jgi:hypothetical protein
MPIGTWLLAMISPLVGRVLVALGLSVVSVTGMNVVLDSLRTQFVAGMQTLPAAGLQLALLGGAGTAMGIIFGACATRLIILGANGSLKRLGAK